VRRLIYWLQVLIESSSYQLLASSERRLKVLVEIYLKNALASALPDSNTILC